MGSLQVTQDNLQQSWRLLLYQWETTSALWRDAAHQRFLITHMGEYEPAVSRIMAELQRLDQVIAQARRAVK